MLERNSICTRSGLLVHLENSLQGSVSSEPSQQHAQYQKKHDSDQNGTEPRGYQTHWCEHELVQTQTFYIGTVMSGIQGVTNGDKHSLMGVGLSS